MSEHHHDQRIPLGALLGAAALMLATIGLAGGARYAHSTDAPPVAATDAESVLVRFQDRPDGTITMLDATTGREVAVVPPQSNGFVRGVLRGMFRVRKLESMGNDGTFRLGRESDGRLTLLDPESGRRVDLESFGPTNAAAFGSLLAAGKRAR